jgi:hypothetical protein
MITSANATIVNLPGALSTVGAAMEATMVVMATTSSLASCVAKCMSWLLSSIWMFNLNKEINNRHPTTSAS